MGIANHSAYATTKAALRTFACTRAAEFKGEGTRVSTLSSGDVDTPMLDGQASTSEETNQMRQAYTSLTPIGRLGRQDELAAAALYLASDEGSFVN